MLFTSCSYIEQYIKEHESEGVIASIGDKKLYKEDIENLVPKGTNPTDSATIVDTYIRRWATDILILQNAERNISNQSEINKMVENYRRTLTIHYYKQEMVNEKVKQPTDEETTQFYQQNQQLFTLQQPIIKGAIMKVPNNIKTDKIQRKFKNLDNIAEIEKTHGERFGMLAELLEQDKLFVSDVACKWICLNCGFVYEGTEVPKICPVCEHDRGFFIRLELAPFTK
jgi:rubrerythrin